MNKVKVVKSFNDANVLLNKGYNIVKIDRDKFNKKFLVFIFEYSDNLIEDLRLLEKVQYR